MPKRLTNEEFIERVKQVHGDKYLLDKLVYRGVKNHVTLTCRLHGDFSNRADCILEGQGCPICRGTARHTTEQFIEKARKIHGDKYDYSKVNYWQAFDNVTIICPIHGEFSQQATAHLRGHGCPKCAEIVKALKKRKTNEEYIAEAKAVHGDKYDYSVTNYVTARKKVDIRCKEHGIFSIMPRSHLGGIGCPICSESHLETEIRVFLENNSIEFERQKRFDWLINKVKMSLDFYLPKYNIGIECQGVQHFNSFEYFGGDKVHEGIVYRDKLKKSLCDENGVELIYFTHQEINDEEYLGKLFKDTNELKKYLKKQ